MNTVIPSLTPWQCTQAAMLYHFASFQYLKQLHERVSQLVGGIVDPMLNLATIQNRDSVLVDKRWGTRNTSENWANHAWPFLKDLQVSLSKDIALRAVERYQRTSTNDCLRGVDEYSMQWATPQEEQAFQKAISEISAHAANIDATLDDFQNSRWNDFGFAYEFPEFAGQHPLIPQFRVRTDVDAESYNCPPRTGVYVAQDDPHAALQFGWTGNGGGKLRPASTFNEIGLDALQTVGRADLWFDHSKMYSFATSPKYAAMFRNEININGKEHRKLASPAVAAAAFVNRPCKWYFLEILGGEFQTIEVVSKADHSVAQRARIPGGSLCCKTGFYFTPAQLNSRRHFVNGQPMPNVMSGYGDTIWQWDQNQEL